MSISTRSIWHARRVLPVALVLLFLFILLGNSDWVRRKSTVATDSVSRQIWNAAHQRAASLLPRPHDRSQPRPEDLEKTQSILASSTTKSTIKAAFISLVRDSELDGMLNSIHDIETRFNHNHHYDWVFLNDESFTHEFKMAATAATSGRAKFGKIDVEQWSYPSGLDQQFAAKEREDMGARGIMYGASESYRHMCRYQSGFFYRHPLVREYEWYWRVEPNIEILCDVPYDPFQYLAENGKKYGFAISLNENNYTVASLWTHVRGFMKDYPQHLSNDNHLAFVSEDGGLTNNYCHFWDNFEIASLEWFRSQAYEDFFNYLDRSGGFFYERWGDASVHSIAAALMLDKGQIHFFDDVGYHHAPLTSCPRSAAKREELNCNCREEHNMDWNPSCTKRFFEVAGIEFPEGYDRNVPPEPNVPH